MSVETVTVRGESYTTLKELLRPGLRAVFVNINPAPKSVAAGHYYRGRHGNLLWKRLQEHGIVRSLPIGREDEAAFSQGIGFADLVRRPTPSAKCLSKEEKRRGAYSLVQRLVELGQPRPAIVFVYVAAEIECRFRLFKAGFSTYTMPGPYARREDVQQRMRLLAEVLGP